jgi:putative ABC transport system substrate-binding protein
MWYSTVGFLVLLTLSLLAAPLAATAQAQEKIPQVGVLEPGSPQHHASCLPAFQQGLRNLGYVEGHPDRLSALAAELVQLAPDVIWLHSSPAALVAKQMITTIPVVIGVGTELAERGIVASLAQPGGNITGLDLRVVELMEKQLALFKEAVPTIARVAVLVDPTYPNSHAVPRNLEREARALGVQLQRVEAGDPEAFEAAFAAMQQGGANALMIMDAALFAAHQQRLLDLALQHRLPTMSGGRHFAEAGSLLAYGAYAPELCQRSAVFVDKILKGAQPATLPVERAYKFYLHVNLKTAAALGLTLPPTFLAQVDEVLK